MDLEQPFVENKVEVTTEPQELWELSFVEDFKYQRNIKKIWYIAARLVYQNIITFSIRKEPIDVNLIFDRVIGGIYNREGKVVQFNSQRDTEKIDFRIDKSDLGKVSKSLIGYREFGLNWEERNDFKKNFLVPNHLFEELHYAPVHLLKSDKNGIDYFILPSYEVLRYFFLKGSRLNKFLFMKFLLSRKDFVDNNNELYVKMESEENGIKRHFLMTRLGFSDSEYRVICRMAYVKNAYECVEKVRDSLLRSNQRKDPFEFKTLRTIIPQDESLDVYCSGKRFHYNGKNYFLIDEIHQTREHIPIKDVELIYFSDTRRNPKDGEGGKNPNKNGGKKGSAKKTKPTENPKFTSDELGNDNIPAEVDIFNPKGLFYNDCDDFNLIKHGKIDSGNSYEGKKTLNVPADILSLAEGIDKNSKIGRANTHSSSNSESDEIKERREVFYKAINALRLDNMIVSFFQIKSGEVKFTDSATLVEPDAIKPEYKTIICEIQIRNNGEFFYLYVVKSDYLEDEVSRYAMFNNWGFKSYDLNKLRKMHLEIFSKKGIKTELNNNNYNLRDSIQYHNQSNLVAENLKDKIKREINKKVGIVEKKDKLK